MVYSALDFVGDLHDATRAVLREQRSIVERHIVMCGRVWQDAPLFGGDLSGGPGTVVLARDLKSEELYGV